MFSDESFFSYQIIFGCAISSEWCSFSFCFLLQNSGMFVEASFLFFSFLLFLFCVLLWLVVFITCDPCLQYMNSLSYLSSEAFSSIPPELVPDLQKMLSANETFRPTALDFTGKHICCLNPVLMFFRSISCIISNYYHGVDYNGIYDVCIHERQLLDPLEYQEMICQNVFFFANMKYYIYFSQTQVMHLLILPPTRSWPTHHIFANSYIIWGHWTL